MKIVFSIWYLRKIFCVFFESSRCISLVQNCVQMVELVNVDTFLIQYLSIKWEGSKVIPLFSAGEDKCLQIHMHFHAWIWKIHEKGIMHLFAKYLRECGSIVWVVGIISSLQKYVLNFIWLCHSYLRPVQIRRDLCRYRTKDPHGGR